MRREAREQYRLLRQLIAAGNGGDVLDLDAAVRRHTGPVWSCPLRRTPPLGGRLGRATHCEALSSGCVAAERPEPRWAGGRLSRWPISSSGIDEISLGSTGIEILYVSYAECRAP